MANDQGKRCLSPSAVDCVKIRSADTTGLDSDIDIAIFERLQLELRDVVSNNVTVEAGL